MVIADSTVGNRTLKGSISRLAGRYEEPVEERLADSKVRHCTLEGGW